MDRETVADPKTIQLYDPKSQFAPGYLSSFLGRRDQLFKDVYADNVHNPANITVVD